MGYIMIKCLCGDFMEMSILYAIQNIRCDFLDWFMVFITNLGNSGIIWIIIGITMLFFKKYRKCGIAILIALLFCLIFGNGLLKNLVKRLRPCWIDNSVKLLIGNPWDYSFPSGHSFSSFAAAISITYFHKKEGIFAFVLAFLIAFSRLYLFVHYPTDILGGGVLGAIAAFIGIFAANKIYKNEKGITNQLNSQSGVHLDNEDK